MIKEHPTAKSITKHTALARTITRELFGSKTGKFEYMAAGLTNYVFETKIKGEAYIIRISDFATKLNDFIKEQWAIARARENGIPVADILEVGNTIIPFPYMVQKKLNGEQALHHPEKKKILNQMGEIAAKIHTIKTHHFGKAFDWSENQLSKNSTWKEFLETDLQLNHRLDLFRRHKMLSPVNLKKLKAALSKIGNHDATPVLHHGDLRRKNVIINKKGDILAIIDWEECCSSIPPFWDLAIALHDLSVDDKQSFLEGYGITPKEYSKMAHALKALNIINYAPAIEELVNARDKKTLDFYRLRLNGDLDLYSF